MDELITCLFEAIQGLEVFTFLTPNARNENRKTKQPVVPHWEIFFAFSLMVTILFLIWLRKYFNVDLILYIIFAVIFGIIVCGILYFITINLANFIYLKTLKRK